MKGHYQQLKEGIEFDFLSCIGCDSCMKVCPVEDENISITELNESTKTHSIIPKKVVSFAYNCMNCSRCSSFCPAQVKRDELMIFLKHRVMKQEGLPRAYKKYLHTRGPGMTPISAIKYAIQKKRLEKELGELKGHLDKEKLKEAKVVFMFGDRAVLYPTICKYVLRIARFLGTDYEVLAGKTVVSGYDHYLAGEFKRAEYYEEHLYEKLMQIKPKIVVCLDGATLLGLRRVQHEFKATFEVVSGVQWLEKNSGMLPLKKTNTLATFQEDSLMTHKVGISKLQRKFLGQLYTLVELADAKKGTTGCHFHNYGVTGLKKEKWLHKKIDLIKHTGVHTVITEDLFGTKTLKETCAREKILVKHVVEAVYENIQGEITQRLAGHHEEKKREEAKEENKLVEKALVEELTEVDVEKEEKMNNLEDIEKSLEELKV